LAAGGARRCGPRSARRSNCHSTISPAWIVQGGGQRQGQVDIEPQGLALQWEFPCLAYSVRRAAHVGRGDEAAGGAVETRRKTHNNCRDRSVLATGHARNRNRPKSGDRTSQACRQAQRLLRRPQLSSLACRLKSDRLVAHGESATTADNLKMQYVIILTKQLT